MIPHRRRSVCPSLSHPMQTGDGLLARLNLNGRTIPLTAATALCAAAREHGNGIIEITSRGSFQVRGLSPDSAPAFIAAVADIGLAAPDGVPVVVDPLAGLAAGEVIDAAALAAMLRRAIGEAGLNERLAPKVAVTIDGGGALHLGALSADLRLRAESRSGGARMHIAMGGTAASATAIGSVHVDHAVDAAVRLLSEIAARGVAARGRDLLREDGVASLRAAVADLLRDDAAMTATSAPLGSASARPLAEPVGVHALREGTVALGIGLAFSFAEVESLRGLVDAARSFGASGLRVAPDRALLILGIRPDDADALASQAGALGFIARGDDPRRAIAVCPGAPFCNCTDMPVRALAPAIAAAAAPLLDGSLTMHLSGCGKGCAHLGAAAVTIVGDDGRCGIVVGGVARDRPAVSLAPDALPARLAALAESCVHARQPGDDSAAMLARLGPDRVAAVLAGAPA